MAKGTISGGPINAGQFIPRIIPAPDHKLMSKVTSFEAVKNTHEAKFANRIQTGEFTELITFHAQKLSLIISNPITKTVCESFIKNSNLTEKQQKLFDGLVQFRKDQKLGDADLGVIAGFLTALQKELDSMRVV